jgi:hypothetical protein
MLSSGLWEVPYVLLFVLCALSMPAQTFFLQKIQVGSESLSDCRKLFFQNFFCNFWKLFWKVKLFLKIKKTRTKCRRASIMEGVYMLPVVSYTLRGSRRWLPPPDTLVHGPFLEAHDRWRWLMEQSFQSVWRTNVPILQCTVQYSMYDDATLTTQMWLGHCCSCHPTPRFAQRLIRRKIDWYHCRVIEFWCGGACNVDCVLCSSSMGSFLLGRGGFNLCVISLHLSCPRRRYRLLLPAAWFWTRNVRHTIAGPTKATLIPVNIMSEFVRLEVRGGCWLLSCSKMSGGPFWLFDQYNTRRPRVNLCPWCILYHSGTTMLLFGSSFQ